jgi:hypothetical protein
MSSLNLSSSALSPKMSRLLALSLLVIVLAGILTEGDDGDAFLGNLEVIGRFPTDRLRQAASRIDMGVVLIDAEPVGEKALTVLPAQFVVVAPELLVQKPAEATQKPTRNGMGLVLTRPSGRADPPCRNVVHIEGAQEFGRLIPGILSEGGNQTLHYGDQIGPGRLIVFQFEIRRFGEGTDHEDAAVGLRIRARFIDRRPGHQCVAKHLKRIIVQSTAVDSGEVQIERVLLDELIGPLCPDGFHYCQRKR